MTNPAREGPLGDLRVVVIGGGGTGAAVAHDFSLRGARVTLVERGELTSGTTGRHHGQLHSGARYAVGDTEIARECMQEVRILQNIAPESMEMNYGLFLAVDEIGEFYGERFAEGLDRAGIPHRRLEAQEARRYEPGISLKTRFAYLVPDGTLDAYRLPLQFFASAASRGAIIRNFTRATSIETEAGRVVAVLVYDHRSRREERLAADVVVNAAGPWAGMVAALAGVALAITPAPGTMVALKKRRCNMVVSRMGPPSDGDILVPQRGLSIIGSTQWQTRDPDDIATPPEDIRLLIGRGAELLPEIAEAQYHAAWTAVRPLAGQAASDDAGRGLSRDFECRRHDSEKAAGLYSVIGGKATVLRAMAEATVDTVLRDLGEEVPCNTRSFVLPGHRELAGVMTGIQAGRRD